MQANIINIRKTVDQRRRGGDHMFPFSAVPAAWVLLFRVLQMNIALGFQFCFSTYGYNSEGGFDDRA